MTLYNSVTLLSFVIPNSVTSMGEGVFFYCTNIASVILPNTITSINNQTFRSCWGLTSVTLPNTVNSVGQYAFSGCSSLSSVIIPDSVTCIDTCAFFQCYNLTSVTIGSSVTFIGYEAFGYCCNLDTMYCFPNVPPTLGNENWGEPCSGYPLVFVSCTSFVAYQNATNWSVNTTNIHAFPGSSFNHNITSCDETRGSVSINVIDCNIITTAAISNYGYHFTQWSDGNIDNPRTITLTQDTSFTAQFAKNQYTINVATSHTNRGSVTGGGMVDYLDSVTVTATANYGYHFDHWSDGSTDNPHTITVTQNATITAYFEPDLFTITLQSANPSYGYVEVDSIWNFYLSSNTFSAIPNYGYHFTHWNDGVAESTRTITLTQDTTFTASFAPNQYNLTAVSADETMGTVSGGGTYDYGNTITVTANPVEHYHFLHWNDGNTDNPRTVLIEGDRTLTAFFAIDTHTVSVTVNDISRGMVETSGTEFIYGTPCTVTATAYSGYVFSRWSNNVTYNPYTFAVMEDVELTAIFVEEGTQGISDVGDIDGIKIYTKGRSIHINGIGGQYVSVYSVDGRIIATKQNATEQESISAPSTGVYFIKVGEYPARKVVVLR